MKLYADEADHEGVRGLATLAVSSLARVEVPTAIWRKHRLGELDATAARVLVDEFEADLSGDDTTPARFAVLAVSEGVLDGASRLVAIHPLRAFDAVQLASALAARQADPDCASFACFDETLRAAALAEGLDVVP